MARASSSREKVSVVPEVSTSAAPSTLDTLRGVGLDGHVMRTRLRASHTLRRWEVGLKSEGEPGLQGDGAGVRGGLAESAEVLVPMRSTDVDGVSEDSSIP